MNEVQSRHVLVGNLRIYPDHFGMIESSDESEVRARRRHIDIATRFVGFGFERKLETILLIDVVLAKIVDGFAQVLHRMVGTSASIGLRAFTSTPEHEDLRSEFGPELHRAHGLLHRVRAYVTIVSRERAIPKYGIVKEIHRGHWHHDAVALASRLEFAHDTIAFGRRCVDRDEIVIMKIQPPPGERRCRSVESWGAQPRQRDRGRGCPLSTIQKKICARASAGSHYWT